MFGIFSTNVDIDKAGAYHVQVTAVLSLFVLFLELLTSCAVI